MRTLLLTGMPPCTNYTAGIVLQQLCSFLPKGSCVCFAVVGRSMQPEACADPAAASIKTVVRPRERWRRIPGPLGGAASFAMESATALTRVKAIQRGAIRFGKEHEADRVWCILEGQTLIRLGLPVARGLGVPLYTQIWDPPGWWMRHNRVDRITSWTIREAFKRALQESEACAAASWAMANAYSKRYGIRAVPVLPGLPRDLARNPATAPHDRGEVVIAVAGQIYATREWEALLAALDLASWTLASRRVRVIVLGPYLSLRAQAPASVHYLGWHTQPETIGLLSEADLLYCPYWFDEAFEEEARLSFPSKLTSYLASGRPVFFHGPEYSSPAVFLRQQGAAFLCHSLEPSVIRAQLDVILSDVGEYAVVAHRGRVAFDAELTAARMRARFNEFLGEDG